MCWFCDDIKKFINERVDDIKEFINKRVVVYDDATASASKEYCHYGLRYCPNCGEKIEDFDNCASKENYKNTCEIEKLKRDVEDLKKDLDDILIGDRDLLTESYIENKRKTYKGLKADRRWLKDQLDNCSFDLYDVEINLAALRRIDKKISEIESSKIFKYIKEDENDQ